MLSSPFMWLSPLSAMPRLKRRFASVVLPSMNLHGRVDVFVGRFTRPSQAGRLMPFSDPGAQTTNWFCASCEAFFRERIEAFGVRSSLFASKGDLRRFNQGSVILHISCFTHDPRYALPRSSRLALFRWKVKRAATAFSGLP
jgi:hypothetical protein